MCQYYGRNYDPCYTPRGSFTLWLHFFHVRVGAWHFQVRPDAGVEDPADTEEKGGVNGGSQGTSGGIDMTSTVLPIVAVVGFAPLVALFFWLMHRRCHRDDKLKPVSHNDRHLKRALITDKEL